MCGRYNLNATPRRLARQFRLSSDQFELFPRYNIAPSQPVVIIRQNTHTLQRELTHVLWGLIPSWAKDVAIGNRMINARSESAAVKPGFRGAMKYRRCIVPADGFYEWKEQGNARGKLAYYIHRKDDSMLALAGLWEHWQGPGGEEIETCALLTTTPNELMATIHDRMPVILAEEECDRWIDTTIQDVDAVTDLLGPCPADWLTMVPVSSYVNSQKNDGERCMQRVEVQEQGGLFGET